jgi:hypothetical protein
MKTKKQDWELTEQERAELQKLTPREQKAVDAFIAAAKALPESICLDLSHYEDDEESLSVMKRYLPGCAKTVATLNKPSLIF